MKLKVGVTDRGFPRITFDDLYREKCSLQLSSLAETPAVWFGVENPKAQVLRDSLWQEVPLPDDAVVGGRMHLSHDQVKALLPYLKAFADTGDVLPEAEFPPQDQQFMAEIKKTSKYASQIDLMLNHPIYTYPFACVLDSDGGGEYVVKGGVGGRYRLADVNLYAIVDGRKIRLK